MGAGAEGGEVGGVLRFLFEEFAGGAVGGAVGITFPGGHAVFAGVGDAGVFLALEVFGGLEGFGLGLHLVEAGRFGLEVAVETSGALAFVEVGFVGLDGAVFGEGVTALREFGTDLLSVLAATALTAPHLFIEGEGGTGRLDGAGGLALAKGGRDQEHERHAEEGMAGGHHESLASRSSRPSARAVIHPRIKTSCPRVRKRSRVRVSHSAVLPQAA